MEKREFTVADAHQYNRTNAVRWIISQMIRYPHFPLAVIVLAVVNNYAFSNIQLFIGRGFDVHVAVPFNQSIEAGLKRTAHEVVAACPTGALALK